MTFRCETPICCSSYFSMNLFNEGFKVRGVFLDIPEAFDKVKHGCFNSNCSNMVGKVLCYVSPDINSWNNFNLT